VAIISGPGPAYGIKIHDGILYAKCFIKSIVGKRKMVFLFIYKVEYVGRPTSK
jgi:hypothetical protein